MERNTDGKRGVKRIIKKEGMMQKEHKNELHRFSRSEKKAATESG